MFVEHLEKRRHFSSYYVSPTGNDLNNGTSASAPWRTIAKVNATSFQPGDQILLQRGGVWRESLVASSSGSSSSPISYASYGDPLQPNPLLCGSDVLNNSAFVLVAGTTSTYSLTTAAAINWVFDNHQFTHHSNDVTLTGDRQTNLNYVNSTAGSWYLDIGKLYVNLGGSLSGHLLTAAVRVDAVGSNGKNNLVFRNLDVTETAQDGGGYGYRIEQSSNVQVLDCAVSLAGKHHFGVIDTTGFVGQNLTASQAPPDLGYGGASACVSFSDNINGRSGDTSKWINVTWNTPNGPYPIIIAHGDPGAIGSVWLENLNCSGWGGGIVCYNTGPSETITIRGGHFDNASIQLDTDNSVIEDATFTGAYASVALNGNRQTVRNCLFDGQTANPLAGHNGVIIISGQYDTITNNVFRFGGSGAAVCMMNATTNTSVQYNVFDGPNPIWQLYNGASSVNSDRNVVRTGVSIESGDINHQAFSTWQSWSASGHDTHSWALPPEAFTYSSDLAPVHGRIFAFRRNFDGTLLAREAYFADTNLDGKIDVIDLGALASNYGKSGLDPMWSLGDANFDGIVNVTDLGLLGTNFGKGATNSISASPAEALQTTRAAKPLALQSASAHVTPSVVAYDSVDVAAAPWQSAWSTWRVRERPRRFQIELAS